ncbi:hypothetical protein B0H13DRAFT_2379556 [Mycena leptocephala]|nr:hypothetical protein B0H13DRAFT_2379556 [Mycena leptocephala]
MDIPFLFTFQIPALVARADTTTTSSFSFTVGASQEASPRAQAQARYRERHKDDERDKARQRMHRLRERRKEEHEAHIRRQAASALLCQTPLFARYKTHVQRHIGPLYGEAADPAYIEAMNRFRSKGGPPFDQEDAAFILKYSTPHSEQGPPPSQVAIDEYVPCLTPVAVVLMQNNRTTFQRFITALRHPSLTLAYCGGLFGR